MNAENAWNPRFVFYARAHGREPEAQVIHDRKAWPGGTITGFALWVQERWLTWDKAQGHKRHHIRSTDEHSAFDRWLEKETA